MGIMMVDKHPLGTGFRKLLICIFYFLTALSLFQGQSKASSHERVDLFFVIDNSGSMRKNDPDSLTPQTVRTFLQHLSSATRVGMVMFDQKARLLEPLGLLADQQAKQRLMQSLDEIDYRGKFTDSAAGIERALYELKTSGSPEARRCLIFITDGIVDTGNKQKDAELTQWLKNDLTAESRDLGIRIFGIAFTENADFALIQALAQRTGGSYYRAYNPEDIADVLDQIQSQLVPAPVVQPTVQPDHAMTEKESAVQKTIATGQEDRNGVDAAPKPSAAPPDRGFFKFYLSLILIIFILIGLLVYLVYKVFGWPPRAGVLRPGKARDIGSAPPEVPLPEWQLHNLENPESSATHFNKLKISIGRDEKNDLVIAKPTVSNIHATIEFRDETFFLEDQRSTNGTRLNDRQVEPGQPVRLKSGDRIKFANHEYKFVRLDQLISGDTIMMSVTSLAEEPRLPGSPSSTLRADDEKNLFNTLEHHLDQIKALGVKYNDFVIQYLAKDTVRTLSIQARENMQQTMADSDQHCSPLIKGRAFFVVCTLPVPIARTAEWFTERYGGFTQFVFKWIRSDAYDVTACDVFCIVTFGLDQGHWVSITIVPTYEGDDTVEIMSVDFLTEAEKVSLALDFDDHGRVL
jgi:pSer/pThr/pTyr-binding forkhead associated (FHA) protein/Mg-chelatase subunit ChlD